MKLCTHCTHFVLPPDFPMRLSQCKYNLLVIDGGPFEFCQFARQYGGHCGKDGAHWERAERESWVAVKALPDAPKKTLIQRLFFK